MLAQSNRKFTYDEYLAIAEKQRAELIDGEIYLLSSPTFEHQRIISRLNVLFENLLEDNECVPVISPFDVILEDKNEKNIVQPDLLVICEREKINERGFAGVPALIVEVLSHSTASRDYVVKMNLYMRFGVKEYWIINPQSRTVEIFNIDENGYYGIPKTYSKDDIVKSQIFDFIQFPINKLFDFKR
ncbi:hypothetical protein ABG79_02407 [Caloramator mitchellensis]|uniref:Putative restriction endonuclease domain-containing protein n=1 Tax=Caloramator mitchellensis TaxID=908809 RepID=A0A0R3JQS6_CALMK|nr:Uma2 family endonuclease [Caloramator mitchellensis]KRQ85803.1 hypothetical protein ABG79_02407 [Caloramator mitchellensis]